MTYNGYVFPLAALAANYVPAIDTPYLYVAIFIILSILMASGRFVTPEL